MTSKEMYGCAIPMEANATILLHLWVYTEFAFLTYLQLKEFQNTVYK